VTRFMPVLALIMLVGCGAPSSPGGGPQASQPSGPWGTLKIAWATEPENLSPKLAAGSGLNEYFWVFNSFLTYYDFAGAVHPMMAREVPSQERGDWVVRPDGTMVTTYRLRDNVRWHDGAPITAQDFAFGYEVYIDPEMPIRDRVPEHLMSAVDATSDDTIVITWKQPYLAANTLTFQQLSPLPRHLSEQKYRANKANFVFGEEWTTAYVGNGPFRLDRWTPGASLVAKANTDWFMGPPKLDTVEIRFISDGRTQLANVLAGEVDLINSPGVRAPEAVVARDQWSRNEGYITTWSRQTRFLAFQFREVPSWQRALTDVRVRRAVMHATDRDGIAETLTMGLGKPAHAFIVPTDILAADVDRAVMKYPYDANRASQLLSEAGWARPPGSSLLTNASGQTLDVEIWTTPDGGGDEESAIMADNWKRVGVNSSVYHIPAARQRDLEHRVSFPAVNASARSTTLDNFVFTTAHLPTPEARWQGANRGSFSDVEVDRLYNAALTTFDERDRREAVVGLHRRMAETLGVGMLYFNVELIIARARVKGPVGEVAEKSGMSWNIFEWEVTD
jgi:peptide/nickel transport system substrate-binding protein